MAGLESVVGRRDFLKGSLKLTGAVAGGALAGAFLGQEIKRFKEKEIVTPSGVFYPLYERHTLGIRPQDLPPQMDLFWAEGPSAFDFSKYPTEGITQAYLDPAILSSLTEKKAKVAFSDVLTKEILPGGAEAAKLAAVAGGLTACSVLAVGERLKIIRSQFLKRCFTGLIVLESWVCLPGISGLGASFLLDLKMKNDSRLVAASERILRRAQALSLHSHPEETSYFYRNALWADKLLTLAEREKEKLGRKPHSAYNVGASHAGVEDFLLVGKDFCRGVVASYPTPWLKEVVEENGGIKAFSSICLVDLGKKPPECEFITDKQLVEDLEKKLGVKA